MPPEGKCPFPHNLPAVPTEAVKREEKKEKFSEYPPAIEFLGLLMVRLGVASEATTKSLIESYRCNDVKIWYRKIRSHKVREFGNTEYRLSNLLDVDKGFLTPFVISCIFPNWWEVYYGKKLDELFSLEREGLISFVEIYTSTIHYLRNAVLNAALKHTNQKLSLDSLEESDLFSNIYKGLRGFVNTKRAKLPSNIKAFVLEIPPVPSADDKTLLLSDTILSEIRSGIDQLLNRKLTKKATNPRLCRVAQERSGDEYAELVTKGGELAYASFRPISKYIDDKGRFFYLASACPFTTAIPGVKEL